MRPGLACGAWYTKRHRRRAPLGEGARWLSSRDRFVGRSHVSRVIETALAAAAARARREGERGAKQEPSAGHRIVTDANGREYRIGESPEQILGRPRGWMMWLPWIAMMAVSVFEYGY